MASLSSTLAFFHRQFFVTPTALSPSSHPLNDRCALVTGSNIGLGLEAARHLLRLGLSTLILAVRSLSRGDAAAEELRRQYPSAKILVWEVDMANYDSVRAFAKRCEKNLERLDFAILNAGVVKLRFERNPVTGHEETVQVNVLGTALLATLLLPVVAGKAGKKPGTVTIVGSETAEWALFAERNGDTILGKLDEEEGYDPGERYQVTKLLEQFFVREVGQRVDPGKVVVNIVNPEFCRGSAIHREVPGLRGYVLGVAKWIVGRTCEVGARPIVNAAVAGGRESHGEYWCDDAVAPMADFVEDEKLRSRVWAELMEELKFADAQQTIEKLN